MRDMTRDWWGSRQLPRAHDVEHERGRSCYGDHQADDEQAECQSSVPGRHVLRAPDEIIRHTAEQPHDQMSRGTDRLHSSGIVEKLPKIGFDFSASGVANRSWQSARVEPGPTPDQAGGSRDRSRSHHSRAAANYKQIYAFWQPTWPNRKANQPQG